jgi:probable lipoprotein NlpC
MTQNVAYGLCLNGKKKTKTLFLSLFAFTLLTMASAPAQIFSTKNATGESARQTFINSARAYLGTPYVRGGTDKSGIDCSGLVYRAALDGNGAELPRTVASLDKMAERVPDAAREPGDLLFFNTTGRISHVGIYMGSGSFIHAASDGPKTGVIVSALSESYWKRAYSHTGRVFKQERINIPDTGEDSGETAPAVNPFPFGGEIGFRLNATGGVLWDFMSDPTPIRGASANAEISWVKGTDAYPGLGAGIAWDTRKESVSFPLTVSLGIPNGFRFFIGTQLHLTAADGLDRSPQFPGILGVSWTSKPARLLGQDVRFFQNAEYSWFPDETFGSGLRFTTGVTFSFDI